MKKIKNIEDKNLVIKLTHLFKLKDAQLTYAGRFANTDKDSFLLYNKVIKYIGKEENNEIEGLKLYDLFWKCTYDGAYVLDFKGETRNGYAERKTYFYAEEGKDVAIISEEEFNKIISTNPRTV